MRSGKLLPADDHNRSIAICWLFAALNSIEPAMSFLAQIDFFTEDEGVKAKQRPVAVKAVNARLSQLAERLDQKDYLVADTFTVADMMTTSVFKIIHHTDILDAYPTLVAYRDRCFDRPAYKKAIADQCREFAAHQPKDMKYEMKTDA
jgi:glutathione S-transferase